MINSGFVVLFPSEEEGEEWGDAGNLNHLSKLSSLSEIRCKYDNVRI